MLVVAPAAADLQIAAREPLVAKPEAPDERDRAAVRGLDVRFDAVQLEIPERTCQHELETRAHQPLTRVRRERVVAEIGGLERVAHDLVEVDHAGELAAGRHDEKRLLVLAPRAPQIVLVLARRRGASHESAMELAAAAHGLEVLGLAAQRWTFEMGGLSPHGVRAGDAVRAARRPSRPSRRPGPRGSRSAAAPSRSPRRSRSTCRRRCR